VTVQKAEALMSRCVIRFAIVGAVGCVIQVAALWVLTALGQWQWLPATIAAVELAVVHNFFWHDRWTWPAGTFCQSSLGRFVAFNLTNGLTSIVGNAVLMAVFAAVSGVPPIAANLLAVATLSAINFTAADRWIFKRAADAWPRPGLLERERGERRACLPHRNRPLPAPPPLLIAMVVACAVTPAAQAAPPTEAVAGWNRYVADAEARIERERISTLAAKVPNQIAWAGSARRSDTRALLSACSPDSESIRCDGESINIPSGTISRWRGSVFLHGVSLDRLLQMLQHPGTPPPQAEIVASRVLSRTADSLQVSIRLVRTAIVTMTYDTEHDMRFERWTGTFATARSVATRIDEAGGDHGFLWRLNSYWRYLQTNDGVLVELESLSLSRTVPALLRPVASPIVTRIARESMVRTLEALRKYVS
jgi:putative flippase GtrA